LVRAQEGELSKPYSNVRLFLFIVFIMHYVYILHSEKINMFYIGYTSDISTRLEFHNKAAPQKFTYNVDDWKLVFSFECETKLQALAAEKHIKKMKSKIYI
jgi:putative endonuclease